MDNSDIQIKQFAPVMIPTLNRHDHFRKCIDSLMRCTHADKTDVYIGLDYPAKDEHWEGYNLTKKYLEELSSTHKFKSLNVIVREKNYGFGKSGNASLLKKEILKHYDRVIFSEDDNIFSPAFLDYINKGLEKFKDDKSILAICGYRHFLDFRFNKNTFFKQSSDFNAWGYGMWKDRVEMIDNLTPQWFRKRRNLKNLISIGWNNGNDRFLHLWQFAKKKKVSTTDIVLSVYLYLEKKYVVMPATSMVKNIGMDRSGVSFHHIDKDLTRKYNNQEIYKKNTFLFIGSGFEEFNYNRRVYKKQGLGNFSTLSLIIRLLKEAIRPCLE